MKEMFMDDPFGVHRIIIQMIVEHLTEESWTPERKDEIIKRMKEHNADLVEHVQIGDYDLVLWHYGGAWNTYAVSLNSGQEDPTTIPGQRSETKAQWLTWHRAESQLRAWVRLYGKLLIGSTLKDKTERYRRLLSRNFLLGVWTEHPDAGFFILPD